MPTPRRHNTAGASQQHSAAPAVAPAASTSAQAESLAAAYRKQQQLDRDIYRSLFQPAASASAAPQSAPLEQPLPLSAARPARPQPVSGLWWTAALFIALSHLLVLHMLLARRATSARVALFTAFQAWLQLLGITAGYHRLWSHRSYRASAPLRVFLAVIGLQAFQGSGYWWAMRHRLHHRFTETDNDPHSIARGLWWAHAGWLFAPPPRFTKLALVGATDLTDDRVLMWQRRWLLPLYVLCGLVYPAAVGWLLGGSSGVMDGVLYVGVVARVLSWHCIWSINSASHYWGSRHYSLRSTAACVHALLQLLQNGEGHHNLHHEFPRDYAHGRGLWEWDPTKWCIHVWCALGLASQPYSTDEAQLRAARAEVLLEKARRLQAGSDNGAGVRVALPPAPGTLPRMSPATFRRVTSPPSSLPFVLWRGLVLDVSAFEAHPGGQSLLRAYHGRDATSAMAGGVTLHTEAAERMARGMAVAKLVEAESGDGAGGEEGEEWVVSADRNVLVEAAEDATMNGEASKAEIWTEEKKEE